MGFGPAQGGGSSTLSQILTKSSSTPNGVGIDFLGSGGQISTVIGTTTVGEVQIGGASNGLAYLRLKGGTTSCVLSLDGSGGLDVGTTENQSDGSLFAGSLQLQGNGLTLSDAVNVVLGTSTGTKIGTATTQKLGFYNATPVVQQTGSSDVLASLVNLGLRAASSNPPLNLGSGALTAGNGTFTGTLTLTGATVTGAPTWGSSQTFPGLTVNNQIQAPAGTRLVLGGTVMGSDAATAIQTLKAQSAWPQAATNTSGAALMLAPGTGTRAFVIVNATGLSGATFTIDARGPATGGAITLTDGSSFTHSGTNSTEATNLANAINANGTLSQLVTATASNANVFITPNSDTYTVKLSVSDAVNSTATNGTDGTVQINTSAASSAVPFALYIDGTPKFSFTNSGNATFQGSVTVNSTLAPTSVSTATMNGANALTLQIPNASGTDTNGTGLMKFTAGAATGAGSAQDILFQDAYVLATGTTVQTQYDRDRIVGKTTTLSTTSGTPTTLISMSTISNGVAGGMIRGVIDVEDGSNHVSSIFFRLAWSASNRAGTVTANAGTAEVVVSDTTTFTTLTTTVTAVVSGTAVLLKVTPSWAVGTPTIVRANWRSESYGQTVGTVQ